MNPVGAASQARGTDRSATVPRALVAVLLAGEIEVTFAPAALKTISDWVNERK